MWKRLRRQWKEISAEKPGFRFMAAHGRLRKWEKGRPHRIILSLIVACILILIGTALGFLPGLPGFLLGVPGIILLIGRSRRGAAGMDKLEVGARRCWKRVKGKRS
jgi:hypothetical protein